MHRRSVGSCQVGTGMDDRLGVYGRTYHIAIYNQSSRPTQPPTLYGKGNEKRPKCDVAMRLGIKGKMDKQVKLCDPSLTRAILNALMVSMGPITKMRYVVS